MRKSIVYSALFVALIAVVTVILVSQYAGSLSDAGIQFTNIQHFN